MTDEPPSQSPLPPPPELFQFPIQLLEQWIGIPAAERLQFSLTRQDIDNLIFAFLRSGEAVAKLDQVIVAWSNNQVDTANTALGESRRLNTDAQNYFRQFATGVMVAALRDRTHAR